MASLASIRDTFLEHFRGDGHEIVPSASLVPERDPTLMFVNAGMVPFKNVFTGIERRDSPRAASSQKCVRAGGKHNDLDNVGYTSRHHTFFEMLGNFSFGDYFKEHAIELAWELITRRFDLPKERLTVTVYAEDEEAHALWRKIAGLPDSRIIRIATSDNFWSMGDTGPCGPCSEIFFDHGDRIAGGPPGSADADGDRFVEVWNLVFMQYEQRGEGDRVALPRPSIDTGMGLERIAAVLQGTHDNYNIDLFRRLIEASVAASGAAETGAARISHRVIADHLRASSFLIADGVLPSNEGRGYVLRRIMRRAMRHAQQIGAQEPLMYRLVPALVGAMGEAYPELARAEATIRETLEREEVRFRETLSRGLTLLEDETAGLRAGDRLSGDVAFRLYDTFGFPLDLTQDAMRSRGIDIDVSGFDTAMARQKAEARAAWAGSGDSAVDPAFAEIAAALPPTEFLGYDTLGVPATIVALLRDGRPVDRLLAGETGAAILDRTPFYAGGGGQVSDIGSLVAAAGAGTLAVTAATRPLPGLIAHAGEVSGGPLTVGDRVRAEIDAPRRRAIAANHSATHILHEALRRHLGDHVAQKGSAVMPERLRFDFSHGAPVSSDVLADVEAEAGDIALANTAIVTRVMPIEDAVKSGARSLFGEKYGSVVRVVAIGGLPSEATYSTELCGGTHVARTGDIGPIVVTGESGVSAGVRRIEALTGRAAREYLARRSRELTAAATALRVPPEQVATKVGELLAAQSARKKAGGERAAVKDQAATEEQMQQIGGVTLLTRQVRGAALRELRMLVDEGKGRVGSGVVAVAGTANDKANLLIGVTDDLTATLSAVDLIKAGAESLGGRGGGRRDFAQAGGDGSGDLARALEAVADTLRVAPRNTSAGS